MFEFAYVHHDLESVEIVNITKNPLDPEVYLGLGFTRPDLSEVQVFCHRDYVEQVIDTNYPEQVKSDQ